VQVASGGEEWATSTTAGRQQALSWLPKAPLLDAFAPKPLLPGVLDAAIKTSSGGKTIGLAVEEVLDWLNEEALTEAAASSLSELQAQEEQLLQQALAASAGESLSLEERLMAEALAASEARTPSRNDLEAAEEADLQAALLLSQRMVPQLLIESSDEEAGDAQCPKRHKAAA
ncbi:Uncharacterized protein SCF082_LOCUS18262, partial [Durusdinium trenchii]